MENQKQPKNFFCSANISFLFGIIAMVLLLLCVFTPASLLLGFIISRILDLFKIDWVIFGGDEGPYASVAFLSFFIPLLFSLIGLISGIKGLKLQKKKLAKIGIILSCIPLMIVSLIIANVFLKIL
jgi:hypothetical protein